MWAGTDDNVKMSLSGPLGGATRDTGLLKLDAKGDDHERGDLCRYVIPAMNLEKLETCTIVKDGRDDWNLETIKGMISSHHMQIDHKKVQIFLKKLLMEKMIS